MALSTLLPNNAMNFTENQQGNVLLERLRCQQESGRFCDVILHVQGKQFLAHRNVLAACSPYFDSVLKMHRIVKEQLTVTCQNQGAFQSLLNYMYTGNVVIDKSNVNELLRLANHFLVTRVKNYCAEYLERYLDISSCLNVKELGEKYNMPNLVKTAVIFIQNNMKDVLEQQEILEYPRNKIEQFLSDKQWNLHQEFILKFLPNWVSYDIAHREGDLRALLTFVAWRTINECVILSHLDSTDLYRSSKRCLYFILESLEENDIRFDQYKNTYEELKTQYGTSETNLDNESFMNIAISTAIEGLQQLAGNENQEMGHVTVLPFENNKEKTLKSSDENGEVSKDERSLMDNNDGNKQDCETNFAQRECVQESEGIGQRVRRTPRNSVKLFYDSPEELEDNILTNSHKRKPGRPRKIHQNQSKPLIKVNVPKRPRGRPPKYGRLEVLVNSDPTQKLDDEKEQDLKYEEDQSHDSDSSCGSRKRRQAAQRVLQMKWKDGVKCPYCVYISRGANRLEQHMSTVHAKDVTYKCGVCEFTCSWNREYWDHMRAHYDGPPYKCESCDYTCERIQFLLTHRMKHTDEKPFQCEECGYRCRTKCNLIAHKRSHTGEKPYKCEHCGRCFSMKGSLDQHMATHSNIRPFLCDMCGFSTKYQSHLQLHQKIHTGDVFRCGHPNCTYFTPKKSQLAAHARTHTAERSHICAVCGRAFIEKSHLVRHERIHLSDKPYKCDQCEYSSTRRDKLKEHVEKHHSANATAKTPFKPRRPRRQTYDPACFPNLDLQVAQATRVVNEVLADTSHHSSEQEPASCQYPYGTEVCPEPSTRVLVVQSPPEGVPVSVHHQQVSMVDPLPQHSHPGHHPQVMYVESRMMPPNQHANVSVLPANIHHQHHAPSHHHHAPPPRPPVSTGHNPGDGGGNYPHPQDLGGLGAFMALF
ncbi:zinc finger protein 652-like isoform X2 [Limulus polyphemus]|nr:zinc finger protein 652-like isoform X2 [Limulus polyphemus]